MRLRYFIETAFHRIMVALALAGVFWLGLKIVEHKEATRRNISSTWNYKPEDVDDYFDHPLSRFPRHTEK